MRDREAFSSLSVSVAALGDYENRYRSGFVVDTVYDAVLTETHSPIIGSTNKFLRTWWPWVM